MARRFANAARCCGILIASIAIASFTACGLPGGGDPALPDGAVTPDPGAGINGAPPKFESGPILISNLSGGDGTIEVGFEFEVTNAGDPGDADSGIVLIAIDGEGAETIATVEALSPGSSTLVSHSRPINPGRHQVVIDVGGVRETLEFSVNSPDLVLSSVVEPAFGDNSAAFRFRLENVGDQLASGVTLLADWVPVAEPDGGGTQGELAVPLGFESLAPGSSQEITFEAEIRPGRYSLNVVAGTRTVEAVSANNRVEFELGVDYVDIVTTAVSVFADDWTRTGEGVVDIEISVENRGLVPSGPTEFGVICGPGADPECGQQFDLPAIPVGSARSERVSLRLPAGRHQLRVFAGSGEDSYLWGPDNVAEVEIEVPPQPAQKLIQQYEWNLIGYLPNGNAKVEVNSLLRNAGSDPIQSPVEFAVSCLQSGLVVPNCGTQSSIDLTDGFGPNESALEVVVPMGAQLQTALHGERNSATEFTVPQRILGVEQFVWDCYNDRPGAGRLGCAGWDAPTVTKRTNGQAITYWATGDPDYIALLEEMIAQVSESLGLEFEPSASRDEANLLAFMGAPKAVATDLGWGSCVNGDGCASTNVEDGSITSGALGVWHQGGLEDVQVRDGVRTALLRDLIHATTAIQARYTLDASIGSRFKASFLETEMLRLNSHPLVEPGMPMSAVRELVVFRDQLLEPVAPSDYGVAYRVIHSAIEEVSDAGSVRFVLTGRGSGACFADDFGPAVYEIGDFGDAQAAITGFQFPNFVRFVWGGYDYVIDRGAYAFAREGDQWRQVDLQAPFLATTWWEGQSGLYSLLGNFLRVTEPANVKVSIRPDNRMTLWAVLGGERATKTMSFTVDIETNRIIEYSIETDIFGICEMSTYATSGQYGVELIDYEAIRRLV